MSLIKDYDVFAVVIIAFVIIAGCIFLPMNNAVIISITFDQIYVIDCLYVIYFDARVDV